MVTHVRSSGKIRRPDDAPSCGQSAPQTGYLQAIHSPDPKTRQETLVATRLSIVHLALSASCIIVACGRKVKTRPGVGTPQEYAEDGRYLPAKPAGAPGRTRLEAIHSTLQPKQLSCQLPYALPTELLPLPHKEVTIRAISTGRFGTVLHFCSC